MTSCVTVEAGESEAMNTTVGLLQEQSGIDCKRTRLTAVVVGNGGFLRKLFR